MKKINEGMQQLSRLNWVMGIEYVSEILQINPKTIIKGKNEHTAGDPMNPDVKWTYLCRTEVKDKLEKKNIFVSKHIVKMLFRINTKKKEPLGQLHRAGKVYKEKSLKSYDHDYSHLQTGKIIPYGIYDAAKNFLFGSG